MANSADPDQLAKTARNRERGLRAEEVGASSEAN